MERKRKVTAAEPQPQPQPELESIEAAGMVEELQGDSDMDPVVGRVKWFDATRGFGFIVSDALDGDILVHFSVLREHGRRKTIAQSPKPLREGY